jgi:OOP family OmpA-OmpF porin
MNRHAFLATALSVLVLSLAPSTVLAQLAWYVGASLGRSVIAATSAEVEQGFLMDDGFVASGTTLDDTDSGWKAYLGYRFNRYLAAEAGYVDLGEASFSTTIVSAPPGTTPTPPFPIHATATAKGVLLSGLANLPLTQSMFAFAKAGVFHWRATFTEQIPTTGVTRLTRTEEKTNPMFGAGLQWHFTPAVAARLEWERFKAVGSGIGGRQGRDVDFLSGGVLIQF